MNETIHDRITQLVKTFGNGKNTVFASLIGVSEANLRGYRNNVIPKYDFLEKIARNFDINLKWLLTGEGEMLCKEEKQEAVSDTPSVNQEFKGAPYYNVDFIGGFDLVLNDQTANPEYYINYRPFNRKDILWCNLTGHSMEPELYNGDIIALKEVSTPIKYLPAGEIYGIVTDEFRTVKRIRISEREGYVRLIPSNKSEEYCEQEIPIAMIIKVYAVLGSIRKFF